jgi:AraC-like DNA-binding protein
MMRKMGDEMVAETTDSIRIHLIKLAQRISHALPQDGLLEIQPGLHFGRFSHPIGPVYASLPPSFCVVVQGVKDVLVGGDTFRYDPAHYLITTLELPLSATVVEASPDRPYLSLRLELDAAVVSSMLVELGDIRQGGDGSVTAVGVSPLDEELLDASLRLVRLASVPNEYRVLAPLVAREIVYRLLMGPEGGRLRHLAKFGGQAHRIARAIEFIRENFNKPLRIESVARRLHMSVSGFHAHFKAVTAMSPLQFQKQLRLQEARRLMLTEQLDAGQAGCRVGYEDAAHFNREYKRHFGMPPSRDVGRLLSLSELSVR